MGTRKNRVAEAVLTSPHNLCFEQKYEKYQSFFISKLSDFGGEIFYIYLNRRVFVMFKVYPQSMFLCRNKKNNAYPFKLQFY